MTYLIRPFYEIDRASWPPLCPLLFERRRDAWQQRWGWSLAGWDVLSDASSTAKEVNFSFAQVAQCTLVLRSRPSAVQTSHWSELNRLHTETEMRHTSSDPYVVWFERNPLNEDLHR